MQYQPYGDNVVVVIGTDDCEATYAGHDIGGEFMWTDVWVKSGATWKCVAHHGSKIPHQFLIKQRPKGTKPRGKKWLEALPARKEIAEDSPRAAVDEGL